MDVLSDVIASVRTGRPHSSRTTKRAPWGAWFEASSGAGFHVMLAGTGWLIPQGKDPIPLGVGDVVFAARGVAHGLADSPSTPLEVSNTVMLNEIKPAQADGEASAVMLCGAYRMDGARSHPMLDELPDIIHLPARLGQRAPLRGAIDLLAAEMEHPGPGTDAVVPALLDTLLLFLLRAWYDEHPASGWAQALGDPQIGAALRAIHDDPARPWTVQELGVTAGLSRAAFARRFTELVAQPPMAYVTWWRLTTAARLLTSGDAPLASIAKQVGYTSEYAFANAFKREYGTAPGRYRSSRSMPALGAL
ncbi:AraC family transcriptional regulator [Mycobacterium sp. 852002-40037_SCH5390672]|uniref:AraC family transcriptional regulator n=1 Tax=Mycobacterium sp. 852002-40037_SCH5390672 TaxID=1834089 RepID=UPI000805068E|nr:AraC family transcriptional regulator [Mycobacterium sp. 852002-40037_SCH5390672]OBB96486.1 AraC family transcriptional regulator [Mycobacterium sp. 852002-40037_SCH5390672]